MLDKKQLRKEKIKESIKEAALKIARKEGWKKVTIRKIADEVLYTPPIVYEFFKNKDDLYRNLVIDGFEKLNEATFDMVAHKKTPEEKLMAVAEIRFDFVCKYETLHHMMFDAENPNWQKMELLKSMQAMKTLIEHLVTEISGEEGKAREFFFNMVCLIKGYTYFQKQVSNMPLKMRKTLINDQKEMRAMFLNAFERFINSIKQKK